MPIVDLTGQKFDRLTVMYALSDRAKGGGVMWHCQCKCGNEKDITSNSLRTGRTKSCGCLNKELAAARVQTHGASRGRILDPLYHCWRSMRKRCNNPQDKSYARYGGRGIKVCKEWQTSYEAFRDYMLALPNCPPEVEIPKARLSRTIDRVNNDGNYQPGNMRWSTRKEQTNNASYNRIVRVNGIKMTLKEVIEKHSTVSYATVLARIDKLGWPLKDAITKPNRVNKDF